VGFCGAAHIINACHLTPPPYLLWSTSLDWKCKRVAFLRPKGWQGLDAQLMAKQMPLQLVAKTLQDYCAVCQ
jgi:hypothetical protein